MVSNVDWVDNRKDEDKPYYVHYQERIARLEAELEECLRQIEEGMGTLFRIECDLGNALYGTSADGLPLWGEHTAETLAIEAARKLKGGGG